MLNSTTRGTRESLRRVSRTYDIHRPTNVPMKQKSKAHLTLHPSGGFLATKLPQIAVAGERILIFFLFGGIDAIGALLLSRYRTLKGVHRVTKKKVRQ